MDSNKSTGRILFLLSLFSTSSFLYRPTPLSSHTHTYLLPPLLLLVLGLVLLKDKGVIEKGRRLPLGPGLVCGMMSRYVLASSSPDRTRRGRRWVRLLLPGGEQGEHGELGAEEEEEGTQLDGLGKAKAMLLVVPGEETPPPRLAQQEEGGGTVGGEWGRGGGAAVGYISKRLCFRRVVWWARLRKAL